MRVHEQREMIVMLIFSRRFAMVFLRDVSACGGIGIRSRLRTYAVFGIPVQVRAGAQKSGDRVQGAEGYENPHNEDSGGKKKGNSAA